MDQIIEMTINRFSKPTGGIGGKTEYPCGFKEHMNKKLRKNRSNTHIELGERQSKKDEADVASSRYTRVVGSNLIFWGTSINKYMKWTSGYTRITS